MPPSSEPAYVGIAQRKQTQLDAGIPAEWKLPAHMIPAGMLSVADSLTKVNQYKRVNVMDIPRKSGILTQKQLDITEKFDIRGLLSQMADGKLSAEEVATGFCKVGFVSCDTIVLFPGSRLASISNNILASRRRSSSNPLSNRTPFHRRHRTSQTTRRTPPAYRKTSRPSPWPPHLRKRLFPRKRCRRKYWHRLIGIQTLDPQFPHRQPPPLPRRRDSRQNQRPPNNGRPGLL